MTPIRIFISSAQREFSQERERLGDYLHGDRGAPVGAPESVAGRIHVPDALHREDGHRNPGHDTALRQGWVGGARVRGRRRLRGEDLAVWGNYPGRIWYYPDHYRNR